MAAKPNQRRRLYWCTILATGVLLAIWKTFPKTTNSFIIVTAYLHHAVGDNQGGSKLKRLLRSDVNIIKRRNSENRRLQSRRGSVWKIVERIKAWIQRAAASFMNMLRKKPQQNTNDKLNPNNKFWKVSKEDSNEMHGMPDKNFKQHLVSEEKTQKFFDLDDKKNVHDTVSKTNIKEYQHDKTHEDGRVLNNIFSIDLDKLARKFKIDSILQNERKQDSNGKLEDLLQNQEFLQWIKSVNLFFGLDKRNAANIAIAAKFAQYYKLPELIIMLAAGKKDAITSEIAKSMEVGLLGYLEVNGVKCDDLERYLYRGISRRERPDAFTRILHTYRARTNRSLYKLNELESKNAYALATQLAKKKLEEHNMNIRQAEDKMLQKWMAKHCTFEEIFTVLHLDKKGLHAPDDLLWDTWIAYVKRYLAMNPLARHRTITQSVEISTFRVLIFRFGYKLVEKLAEKAKTVNCSMPYAALWKGRALLLASLWEKVSSIANPLTHFDRLNFNDISEDVFRTVAFKQWVDTVREEYDDSVKLVLLERLKQPGVPIPGETLEYVRNKWNLLPEKTA